ncbi:hypothetical protein VNO77_23479 [Canavalia gladiata]|uniref:Uncharacterized protein n=1 Tax=Canavalia gladiata TaxID=3824 RepID=A0AAN9L5V0_CANGL
MLFTEVGDDMLIVGPNIITRISCGSLGGLGLLACYMARWLVRMARGLGRVGRLASRLEGLTKLNRNCSRGESNQCPGGGNRTSVVEVTEILDFGAYVALMEMLGANWISCGSLGGLGLLACYMARWLVRMARGLGRVGRLASRLEGLTKLNRNCSRGESNQCPGGYRP